MSGDIRLVIGPNASLSERQAWQFMGLMAGLGLCIAGGFAVLGYWPVLPFAGLELAALGAALWVSLRRNRYREVLTFAEDALVVEFGEAGVGAKSRLRMSRYWTKVQVEASESALAPTRLVLACSGQQVEIGRCLTDEEREHLANRIRQLLQQPLQPGAAEIRRPA